MNRRSFFAFLVGMPIAAVTGLKTRRLPWWERPTATGTTALLDNRCYPGTIFTHENHLKVIRKMVAEQGEAAGSSFNYLKSREASGVMARVDKEFIKKFRW